MCILYSSLLVQCQLDETDFQIFFTFTFCKQFAITQLLNISPHLKCVATLPCEI